MMLGEEAIALRMEAIKDLAIHAQFISATSEDLEEIVQEIEKADPEYRLVAYEGAAMMLVKRDFTKAMGSRDGMHFLKELTPVILIMPTLDWAGPWPKQKIFRLLCL